MVRLSDLADWADAIRAAERAPLEARIAELEQGRSQALESGQGFVRHFASLVRQRDAAEARIRKLETVVQNLASHRHADHCGQELSARPGFSHRSVPSKSWRECDSAHCRMAQEAMALAPSSAEPQAGAGEAG